MLKQSFIQRHKSDIIAEPSGKTLHQLQRETLEKKMELKQLLQLLLDTKE